MRVVGGVRKGGGEGTVGTGVVKAEWHVVEIQGRQGCGRGGVGEKGGRVDGGVR